MPDFRSYCPTPNPPSPAEIVLSREESHHLVVVNRARLGDPVVAFDGHGREWVCKLARESKNAAALSVISSRQAPPRVCEITLAQALPKGPAMEGIVRKATEIGAARIVPLGSERSQVRLDEARGDKKAAKWRVAALEAAKQCGNPWLPEIAPARNALEFMRASAGESAMGHGADQTAPSASPPPRAEPAGDGGASMTCAGTGAGAWDLRLLASLQPGARSLRSVLGDYREARGGRLPKRVLWVVGPEGDFSPAEIAAATAAGIVPVTLGPLVLRCETAATVALGILGYELEWAL